MLRIGVCSRGYVRWMSVVIVSRMRPGPLWWRVGAFHRRLGNWSLKNVNDHGNPDAEKDVVREHLHIL
jgi:hypothetical protein